MCAWCHLKRTIKAACRNHQPFAAGLQVWQRGAAAHTETALMMGVPDLIGLHLRLTCAPVQRGPRCKKVRCMCRARAFLAARTMAEVESCEITFDFKRHLTTKAASCVYGHRLSPTCLFYAAVRFCISTANAWRKNLKAAQQVVAAITT